MKVRRGSKQGGEGGGCAALDVFKSWRAERASYLFPSLSEELCELFSRFLKQLVSVYVFFFFGFSRRGGGGDLFLGVGGRV